MERSDYPAMLPQMQPSQAVDVLNDRVRQVGRLNTAIADWLSARRMLEEQYSAGLRRLAQRNLDAGDIGVFSVPWTTMCGSAEGMAAAHANLAARIEIEIESPLREFASKNREMTAMGNMQGNLSALAKDLEKAQQKAEKSRGKGDASRAANAGSEVESAQAQWDSQAPYVFESLQAVDETRINHLRDLLTQFETLETDTLEKSRVTAEQCLNVLLNVQTEDEIKTFALKSVSGRPSLPRSQRASVSTPSRGTSSAAAAGLTPITSRTDEDRRTTRSGSIQDDAPEEKKSRLGGLKRFGTVLSKRRESRMPANLPSTSESPERKTKTSAFGRLGRSKDSTPNLQPLDENVSSSQRPGSPLRLGSEIFQSPSERDDDPLGMASQSAELSHTNGATAAAVGADAAGAAGLGAAGMYLANGSHQNEMSDLEPPRATQAVSPPAMSEQRDSEGFSVPQQTLDPITQAQQEAAMNHDGSTPQFNLNIRDAPIQEDSTNNEAALASVAGKLQAPPPAQRRSNTVRGRRDQRNSVLNSVYVPTEQQISELAPDSSEVVTSEAPVSAPVSTTAAAPAVVSQPEPSSAPDSSLSSSTAAGVAAGAVGGAGAGILATSAFAPFSPQTEQLATSPFRPDSRTTTSDQTRGDAQSIRSATTTGSQGASRHPELTGPGLNTSIIETIGARFENGKLTSSTLIGEIALAYSSVDSIPASGTETIRLNNFATLEKVAPNPAFINPVAGAVEGDYIVNLASISKPQVAFKYQVGGSSPAQQAPILVTPAFKIEPTQTSVIVSYGLNPAFSPASDATSGASVTFSNVLFALTLEGARASACQSKPVGSFAREKNMIYWQLNDITLTPGDAPLKLLARFTTETAATGGSVDARWEVVGESAVAVGSGLAVSVQGQDNPAAGGAGGADPFADEDAAAASSSAGGAGAGWRSVNGVKKVISGSYVSR